MTSTQERKEKPTRINMKPAVLWAMRQTNSLKLVGTVVRVARYSNDAVVTLDVDGDLIKLNVRNQYRSSFAMQKGQRYFVNCRVSRDQKDQEVIVHSNYFFEAPESLKDMHHLEITGTVRHHDDQYHIFCRYVNSVASYDGERPNYYTESRSYYHEIELPYDGHDKEQQGDGIMFINAMLMTDELGIVIGIGGKPVLIRENGPRNGGMATEEKA